MDYASGLCIGCARTLEEIAGWMQFTPEQKLGVWHQLSERKKRLGLPVSPD
jgi:predicted Fe-S protein YdhL (DUF1289 family)